MAKRTLGYVELEWTCPSCGGRNAGTLRTCHTCGAAMPEDITFELPAEQELDTSEETAKKVAVGPDIHCPYCGTRNPGDATHCRQCGGDLEEGLRRKAGEVIGAHSDVPVPEVACPHCGAKNPASRKQCSQCGGSLGGTDKRPVTPPSSRQPAGQPRKPRSCLPAVLIILAVMLVIGIISISLSRGTDKAVGYVQDVQWTYQVQLLELQPVAHENWRDEVPSQSRLQGCSEKIRRTVDNPVPGATEQCGTPYVVDAGTGRGEVTQDCKYLVPDDWCKYTLDEWRPTIKKTSSGQDLRPYWPELRLASNPREGNRSEKYVVRLLVDDKTVTYGPRTLDEFERFLPQSAWTVTTNSLGRVTDVQPAD